LTSAFRRCVNVRDPTGGNYSYCFLPLDLEIFCPASGFIFYCYTYGIDLLGKGIVASSPASCA
jgi:hypothetical protein